MSGTEKPNGWDLSSEGEEEQVQEVDTRSVELDELKAEKAKDPHATWSDEPTPADSGPDDPRPDRPASNEPR